MNPAIRACQSPLPVAPGRLSSGSTIHMWSSHGSLSVSQSSKGSHLVSRPSYVKCTVEVERFSEGSRIKEENWKKNNIVRGAGRASLVLACVLGAFTLSGKMNSKPNLAYAALKEDRSRGSVIGALHEMTNPKKRLFFKDEPNGSEVEVLKLYAMALSKEDPKGAEKVMRNARRCWGGSAAEDHLLMALTELLLSLWKYQEAKECIDELMENIKNKGGVFDVPKEKVYFLKAIAESATNIERAAQSWEEYQRKTSEETSAYNIRPGR